MSPQGDEREAREEIDRLLTAAGWSVCDADKANLAAHRGVAIREVPLPGQGFAEDLDVEAALAATIAGTPAAPEPIQYNSKIKIETFDNIITDECDVHGRTNVAGGRMPGATHHSIFNLWAQVLEYFDAYLIGLTATPGKQTFGFFHQNLVMEYNHEMAVADGINVNYHAYQGLEKSWAEPTQDNVYLIATRGSSDAGCVATQAGYRAIG